jgi:hypothetical protein
MRVSTLVLAALAVVLIGGYVMAYRALSPGAVDVVGFVSSTQIRDPGDAATEKLPVYLASDRTANEDSVWSREAPDAPY